MVTGLAFTDSFQCINTKCTYNCCGGWQIEIDEETYQKYLQEKGAFGRKLRRNMKVGEVAQIRQRFGKCPYLTKDRLCGMYLEHGEEYMSFACKTFPRRKIVITDQTENLLEEIYLELSCPEVARLFLEQKSFLSFVPVERETENCWQFVSEENDYFEKILLMRETIAQILRQEDIPLSYCLMLVFDYVAQCQQLAMKLEYEKIIDFTKEFLKEESLLRRVEELQETPHSFAEKGRLLHKFVMDSIETIDLRWTNPGMAKLLKWYYQIFKEKKFSEFGRFFRDKQKEMLKNNPFFDRKYRNYFLYYIQQRLLYAVESYNMTKSVIMGIVHTQLLILFDLVYWMHQKGVISQENQIEVLTYLSRTAGHNEYICNRIYDFISKSPDMRKLLKDYIF